MSRRDDVSFEFEGLTLRGWLYVPDSPDAPDALPAVVMTHGFSGVKEQRLNWFAERFADAGMAVVVFDLPRLGASDGEPRGDLDPDEQLRAFETALTWTAERHNVDPHRIGIWGSSYSGGHVLALAAKDKRVRCAVAQVPFVSPPFEPPEAMESMFAAERAKRASGGEPTMIPVVGTAGSFAALPTPDAEAWSLELWPEAPNWINEVTLSSIDRLLHYRPADHVAEIAPTPLMIVVAENDALIPSLLVHDAFDAAGDPKRIVSLECGHFDVYGPRFEDAVAPERDWFVRHLVEIE